MCPKHLLRGLPHLLAPAPSPDLDCDPELGDPGWGVYLVQRLATRWGALRDWDGRMDPETDQPLIYEAWLRELVDTARARENLATAPTTLAGVRLMLRTLSLRLGILATVWVATLTPTIFLSPFSRATW